MSSWLNPSKSTTGPQTQMILPDILSEKLMQFEHQQSTFTEIQAETGSANHSLDGVTVEEI